MKYDYHIAVIGAGSGGLVVASGAASLGAKVALIEASKMGGDCLNYGCVPSKTFLKSAHVATEIRHSRELGLAAKLEGTHLGAVMERVSSVIAEIEPHDSVERYEGLGVTVLKGRGILKDSHTIEVDGLLVTAKNIVLATGSEAAVPPIPGLDTISYLTNRTIFDLKTLPKHLIVLGGGPIGLELGQGFAQLGSKVSVVDFLPHLFPNDDSEVVPIMEQRMQEEGIDLYLSSKIIELKEKDGEKYVIIEKDGKKEILSGDHILVALGRVPNTKSLGLESAGVDVDPRGFIVTDNRLRTTQKNIYACGDSVGPYLFTHMAGYQAGIILRNAIFKLPAKVDYSCVPWVTYTRPEVAHVGYTEQEARDKGLYVDNILVNLADMDRAKAEHEKIGFLKLIMGKKSRIIGATIVGEKGGEMIALAALAIQQKLKATSFLNMTFPYPTQSEIFKFASLAYTKKTFKPWMKTLIQKIFLS